MLSMAVYTTCNADFPVSVYEYGPGKYHSTTLVISLDVKTNGTLGKGGRRHPQNIAAELALLIEESLPGLGRDR